VESRLRPLSTLLPLTLAHISLEFGKRSVGRFVGITMRDPLGVVGLHALSPAHHPLIVRGLLALQHVLGAPRRVPPAEVSVLSFAQFRVRLFSSEERSSFVDVVFRIDDIENLERFGVKIASGVVFEHDGLVGQVEPTFRTRRFTWFWVIGDFFNRAWD